MPANFQPSWRDKVRMVRHSLAMTGLWRTFLDTVVRMLSYFPNIDRSFDRRFGTDTAGMVPASRLGIRDGAVRRQAIPYLPSPESVTRWMLDNIGIDPASYAFVDVGCGKGRVLLVASQYPFRQIMGVEISTELSTIARQNAARFRAISPSCPDIQIYNNDGAAFEFPSSDLLVHFYHPFDPPLTAAILRRLGETLTTNPRQVRVAYLAYSAGVDRVEGAFAEIPWLKQTCYEQSIGGQYDWLFYSN